MRLRLHTRCQNSAGQRVRIVLNLKGVAYEYVAIPSLRNDAFRELSPHGLMPVLEVDGHAVVQSLAIVELLEELFPEPSVLPVEPIARRGTGIRQCHRMRPSSAQQPPRASLLGRGVERRRTRDHCVVSTLDCTFVRRIGSEPCTPPSRAPVLLRLTTDDGRRFFGPADGQCPSLRSRPLALSAAVCQGCRVSKAGCIHCGRAGNAT